LVAPRAATEETTQYAAKEATDETSGKTAWRAATIGAASVLVSATIWITAATAEKSSVLSSTVFYIVTFAFIVELHPSPPHHHFQIQRKV
jgi:hypothetical protein